MKSTEKQQNLSSIWNQHYSGITWAPCHLKSLTTWLLVQQLVQASKEIHLSYTFLAHHENWWPLDSPHKWPVMQKAFPYRAFIMKLLINVLPTTCCQTCHLRLLDTESMLAKATEEISKHMWLIDMAFLKWGISNCHWLKAIALYESGLVSCGCQRPGTVSPMVYQLITQIL